MEFLFDLAHDFVVFEQLTPEGRSLALLNLLAEPALMVQIGLDCFDGHSGFGFLAPCRHFLQQLFLLFCEGYFHAYLL